MPVRVGDEVVGAIGVGGVPSGDQDEAGAQAGLDTLAERLKSPPGQHRSRLPARAGWVTGGVPGGAALWLDVG